MASLYFGAPRRLSVALWGVEALNTIAALVDLCILLRKREKTGGLLAIVRLIYPAVYYFVQADERYRYSVEWSITLCATYSAVWMYRCGTDRAWLRVLWGRFVRTTKPG
jgi:hypothetical protein